MESGRAQTIEFRDVEAILPQFLVVHHVPTFGEWRIVNIEILDEARHLLADGIEFDQLPGSTQTKILGYLNAREHDQRQALHRETIAARAWYCRRAGDRGNA